MGSRFSIDGGESSESSYTIERSITKGRFASSFDSRQSGFVDSKFGCGATRCRPASLMVGQGLQKKNYFHLLILTLHVAVGLGR
jgi:hypothetical protein